MKVEYLGGGFTPGERPEHGLPEVAFMGRSNVGKSSLINTLVNQRQLARVSSTPGRTQALHFFAIAEKLCLVDLPGYGFARAPKHVRVQWKPLINGYLESSEQLKLGLLLVDVRREPGDEEKMLVRAFKERRTQLLVVVTKIDKVAKTRRGGRVQQLAKALSLRQEDAYGFSSQDKLGKEDLWQRIYKEIQ